MQKIPSRETCQKGHRTFPGLKQCSIDTSEICANVTKRNNSVILSDMGEKETDLPSRQQVKTIFKSTSWRGLTPKSRRFGSDEFPFQLGDLYVQSVNFPGCSVDSSWYLVILPTIWAVNRLCGGEYIYWVLLSETNIAPENDSSQKEINLPTAMLVSGSV